MRLLKQRDWGGYSTDVLIEASETTSTNSPAGSYGGAHKISHTSRTIACEPPDTGPCFTLAS